MLVFTICKYSVVGGMHQDGTILTTDAHVVDEYQLWRIVGLGFVVGDIVTTSIGLGLSGVTEGHPFAAHLFQYSVLGTMISLKVAVVGGCYLFWRWVPRPHCVGIPLGLAALGVLVTIWNLLVLFQVYFF
jgi:hypothetical protein